jgi:hypothetical protein
MIIIYIIYNIDILEMKIVQKFIILKLREFYAELSF